jgi:hypothetical protein
MIATWLKGSLLLAATLAAGIAIGVMAERSHMRITDESPSSTMNMIHSHVMQTLHNTLQLDSSQHQAIVETLRRHQLHVDSAWGAMRPHINATLDSTHREIMGLLRPEQREAFNRLIAGHGHDGGHK